jgi:hypothetical protein
MHRPKEARATWVVSQRGPCLGYEIGQIGIDDERLGPEVLVQGRLGQCVWPVLDKKEQELKRLRREWDANTLSQQFAALGVEDEGIELHPHG